MKLTDFYDELSRHDWYYQFSDDYGVWQRGERDSARLTVISCESPRHGALMEAFTKHYYSGKPWGTPESPKPDRPTETPAQAPESV